MKEGQNAVRFSVLVYAYGRRAKCCPFFFLVFVLWSGMHFVLFPERAQVHRVIPAMVAQDH